MTKDYNKINYAFNNALTLLENNIEYLEAENKTSSKYVSLQKRIVSALKNYQLQTEQLISYLEFENVNVSNQKIEKLDHLIDEKLKLEAICFIHGITDIATWINRPTPLLEEYAVEYLSKNKIKLPLALIELLDDLPKHEKATFNRVLFVEPYQ